jgi:hypothetical protein
MLHDFGILVLGQQLDGAWAITEAADRPIQRFETYDDALHHARAECRKRPQLSIASSRGAIFAEQGQ